jgi:hypothetical protein
MFGATPAAALQKRCPSCNRYYDDATLEFCLDDGAPLKVPREVEPLPTLVMPEATRVAAAAVKPARVFISYKRNSDPDEEIALAVFDALGAQHDVFIDQTMPPGTRWADRIDEELGKCDFLITFISAQSINSEMVRAEIEMAHDLAKEHGRPVILPVRVNYKGTFKYPLNVILKPLQWLDWDGPEDTATVIEKLALALAGLPLKPSAPKVSNYSEPEMPAPLPQAQPLNFEMPEGTMDPESKFYVRRDSDVIAESAIARQGVTITIKGPRQMGKSSLLNRIVARARGQGKRVISLDFQLVGKPSLMNADLFYRQFCSWLTNEVELDDQVQAHWQAPLGNSQLCTSYVSRYILKRLEGPLLLAMDEVESIFETDFRTDFFGMLRCWHNNRATLPIWKRLDLALVTSTEPYQLIDNLNQSPFNVGEVIDLCDFSSNQLSDLNCRHDRPFSSNENQKLMELLSGHPYLVRRALYLVATGRLAVSDLFAQAADERGPFGDHLRYHLFRLTGKPELVEAMQKVLKHNSCPDEHLFFRLRGAGLVRREGHRVLPRCRLYETYFQEHLNV